jgi:predicted GNAT family N-acyltransferase
MEAPVRIWVADWDDPQDRADAAFVRRAVFIEEQQVPEELEWDGLDAGAFHLIARDGEGRPVGGARMLPDGHIGRMAVLKPWRGHQVGTALLRRALEEAARRGFAKVYLDAQVHAIGFYERLGFVTQGEEFMDAGIPHRRMVRQTAEGGRKSG